MPACAASLTAAAKVRELREKAGWTQRRLAEEAGMSAGMVCLLEAGYRNFTLSALERVAGALGTDAAALLSGAGDSG
jgi:transcriptional regulator with XRE-family HTH domain